LSAITNINNLKKTKRLLGFLKPDKNQPKKIRELETLGFLPNVCVLFGLMREKKAL
jgi:hypothetical protein